MYITGVGRTKFGILDRTLPELLYEAMYKAVEDRDMKAEDIDAVVVSNFLAESTESQLHLGSVVCSLLPGLDVPSFRVEAACASGGMALYQACSLLSRFENILVVGGEKLSSAPNKRTFKNIAKAGDALRDQKEGLIFPAQYAILASRYFRKFKATTDDLARVSLKNYSNASANPLAHFSYKDVTLDIIKATPVISSPLRLFDCCPLSDGATSIIVSRKHRSRRDVRIIGFSAATDAISLSQRAEQSSFPAARKAAAIAYDMAGISPWNVDIAEVHDCFTIAELVAMEDLGFAPPGGAPAMLNSGETAIEGRLPINTDGGLLADGHPVGATGLAQVCEIATQLRGEAGNRQVDKARIGLSHNVGGVGGTAVIHIMERCS